MKVVIMVADVILRFRLAALEQKDRQPQAWGLQVMTIEEVASILVSLGVLDLEAATRLTEASTTITPQEGLETVPCSDLAALVEFAYPEDEPPSREAQQGFALLAHGETTEDALAAAGFVLKSKGPLQ
jgi:hypothetical protein